jgi:hypothetical protein
VFQQSTALSKRASLSCNGEKYVINMFLLRLKRVDNIELHLREIGWIVVDWFHLPQGRDQLRILLEMVMNIRVPYNVGIS